MRSPACVAVVLSAIVASGSRAATIRVEGPGQSLQAAIDAANPGDTILADGLFLEPIVIDKPLKLRGWAAIDPPCGTLDVIQIRSDDVLVQRIHTYGGSHAGYDVQGVDNVRIERGNVFSARFVGGCPDAQIGVNVVASTNVTVKGVESHYSGAGIGFSEAFLRIADVGPDGNVVAKRVFTNYNDNANGVLIENCSDTPGGRPAVRIQSSHIVGSRSTGVRLRGSSGVEVRQCYIGGHNWTSPQPDRGGVVLESTTSGNVIERNRFYLNAPDILDEGTANQTIKNVFIAPIPG